MNGINALLLACALALGLAACATGGDTQARMPDRPEPNYDHMR